jgi:hypothetical protein
MDFPELLLGCSWCVGCHLTIHRLALICQSSLRVERSVLLPMVGGAFTPHSQSSILEEIGGIIAILNIKILAQVYL